MARTTINSQGVPVGTITASDLTFPLTDFSSTGIDDNASSNAITIDSSGNIAVTGTVDGRDLATDGTKLDGIAASATNYGDSDVATYISGNRSYGNITTTGYIAGPSTFTIDPAAVGDNTGTLVIAGNLQVDGTTTTINSTTMTVDDLNITLASGAANAAAANGAGITVDGASATLTYANAGDNWAFNKNLDVTGNIAVSGTVDGVDIAARDGVLTSTTTTAGAALPKAGGTMTGALIVGETGTSQTPLLVGNSSATDYTIQQWRTGGTSGQTYIIAYGGSNSTNAGNFAVKNTYSSGEIFFQVGSSVEPLRLTSTGATFAGNIAVSGTVDGRDVATDGIKLDGIEALADVTDATNVTAAGALMDSEVTNLAQVKAFDSSDYATAAQGTTAEAALPKSGGTINGTLIVGQSGSNQTPLLVGNSNATNWSILKWQNSIGSGTPYAIAYGGSHSSEAGNFAIKNTYSGGEIFFELASTVQPLRLTSTGATFAGNIAVSGDVTSTGTVAMAGGSTSANLSFSDNAKALFGNGNDLEILHDGNNSYITDVGTGSLYLRGADILLTTAGGTKYVQGAANVLRLYHTGNEKLRTSSTGVVVTGEVIAADTFTLNGATDATASIVAAANADATLKLLETGTGDVGARLTYDGGDDKLYIQTGNNPPVTRMTINRDDGNVGIGTNSPSSSARLDVVGGAVRVYNGSSGTTGFIENSATGTDIRSVFGNGNVTFSTGASVAGTERMRIDSDGNVGIGTDLPSQLLSVKKDTGNVYLDVARDTQSQGQVALQLGGGTGGTSWVMYQEQNSDDLSFYGNGSNRMTLKSNGTVGIGADSVGPYGPNKLLISGSNNSSGYGGNLAVYTNDAVAADKGGYISLGGVYSGSTQYEFSSIKGQKENATAGNAQGRLVFHTTSSSNASVERMRISSDGSLDMPGPHKIGKNQYYKQNYWFGGGTDTNWKKIADVTLGTGVYSGMSFLVKYIDPGSNYGSSATYQVQQYTVMCGRSSNVQDNLNYGTVRGPYNDRVRAFKTATGVYEIQVRQHINYRHIAIEIEPVSDLKGTVTYAEGTLSNGSTTGTAYVPTSDNIQGFTESTTARGHFKVANSSGNEVARIDADGIKFNGDTTSANALNDYEEGTWTPTVTYAGGNVGQVMSSSSTEGTYVKIGNLVTANCRWGQTTKGSSTGEVRISLPFAVSDDLTSTSIEANGSLAYYIEVTVSHTFLGCAAWGGTSYVRFYYRDTDTATNQLALFNQHVANGFDGRFTITYRTT